MPLDITPNTITLDKVRIEQFTVSPQDATLMIHYSKGCNDENGQYVPKEYDHASFKNIVFNQDLYEAVKSALYIKLNEYLTGQ